MINNVSWYTCCFEPKMNLYKSYNYYIDRAKFTDLTSILVRYLRKYNILFHK